MAWYTWYTVVFPHTNSMFYANMIEKKKTLKNWWPTHHLKTPAICSLYNIISTITCVSYCPVTH